MTPPVSRMVQLGVGALATGAAIGYLIGRLSRGSSRSSPSDLDALVPVMSMRKSHTGKNPVLEFIKEHSLRLVPAQEKLIEVTKKHSLNMMLGDAIEMQFLQLLCKAINAKKTLDIGVYTGYSTLSIALVLPEDGKVVACDITSEYPDIGRPYWKEAGVEHKIDLQIAPAAQTLQYLIDLGEEGTFDFAFIDANKEGYLEYYELCLKLVRKGGIIVFDNTLMGDGVLDPKNNLPMVRSIREVDEFLRTDFRVDISFVPVGDGTTLCLVK